MTTTSRSKDEPALMQPTHEPLKFNPVAKKVESFIARITPPEAAYILRALNPNNRPLKEGVAEGYGREMKAGRWAVTNQGIGFSRIGALLDGQHRLWACVDADTAFETLVTVGLDEDSREVIDVGLRRSEADVIMLRTGVRVSPTYVGVGRLMLGKGNRNNGKHVPRQDLLDFLERHAKAIAFACSTVAPVRLVTIAPVLAVVARAYYTVDHGVLARFLRILASGMPEPEGDGLTWKPVLMLRHHLLSRGGQKSDDVRLEVYRKTESALRSYVDGKQPMKLYAASEELFPLSTRKSATKEPGD